MVSDDECLLVASTLWQWNPRLEEEEERRYIERVGGRSILVVIAIVGRC